MGVMSTILNMNKLYNFEQAFGAKDITSAKMRQAIAQWYGLYYATEPTDEEDPSQRIAVSVVAKLYKAVFSEYKAQANDEFVAGLLDGLGAERKQAMQQMLIGGQCFLKPLLTTPFSFAVVGRQNYIPLGCDAHGNITDIGTAETTILGQDIYTLLERRTVDAGGYLTIQSRLYRSNSADTLGVQVPLAALEKYAGIEPEIRYNTPLYSLGLIPLRCPLENCVDGSLDAVSVYAAAVGLLHSINRNEAQINREFANGASRIIASADLLRKDENGRRKLDDHLFTAIDDDPDNVGITIFSPALREQSYLARKTEYLRNVESVLGLKRGLLSDVEAAEKTATEITSSAGEYNLTIIDLQEQWERAVRECIRVCAILGKLYHVYGGTVDTEKDIAISWGNGILYDEDQVWTDYKAMVAANMLKPEIALGWYFDMPTETERDLAKIREKYMPQEAAEDVE